jgi:hypothetical protein
MCAVYRYEQHERWGVRDEEVTHHGALDWRSRATERQSDRPRRPIRSLYARGYVKTGTRRGGDGEADPS